MSNKGYIKLYRQLQDCWIWNDREVEVTKGHAWIDILLSCNHEDKKIMFDGKPYIVKRGEWITSILSLSERWGWGRKKISNFLNILENDGMIVQDRNNKRTIIKVVNYDVYQGFDDDYGTAKEQQRNTEGTPEEHQRNTNNNDKNDNNEKNNNNSIYNKNNIYIVECSEIISYLNQKTGKNFNCKASSNTKYIIARLNEGYSVTDFKKIIDTKVSQWKSNKDMCAYLRPETLFCPKHFESYLNETGECKDGRIEKRADSSELIDGKYTIAELKAAGFTDEQIELARQGKL